MSEEPEPSEPPAPPLPQPPERPQPPRPPPPDLLRPAVPHVPLTPMMDFFQRRMESMERELTEERQRAQAAQSLLAQQETLRSEVETSLKAMREQLRAEKAEKESEQEMSRSRGRIDALEQRLDEMHQTWAGLLKDAMAQRDASGGAVGAAELNAILSDLRNVKALLLEWRGDVAGLPEVGGTLRSLARDIPREDQRLLSRMEERLKAFSKDMHAKLLEMEHRQRVELERQEVRLQELGRERAALQRLAEEQNHAVRQEHLQERAARERLLDDRLGELEKKLDAVAQGGETAARAGEAVKTEVAKVLTLLNTPPQAKDAVITALEREKDELLKALRDRSEALARYVSERRAVEGTMGASMMELNSRLDAERERGREMVGRIAELEVELKAAADRLEAARQAVARQEEIAAAAARDRDALAKSLVAEAEKVRRQAEGRCEAEHAWEARLAETQKRLEAEVGRGADLAATVADLRSQLAALTEHMAKALQERDGVIARFAAWSQEREKLLKTIREKDEMISMLSSTFQGILQKEQ